MSVAGTRSVTEYRRRAFVALIADSPYVSGDPLDEWDRHHPVWEVFQDRDDLLLALQEHWVDLLGREVYGAPQYPLGAPRLREVYAELAEAHPELRAILDVHQDDAVIADLLLAEHVLLARAAGNLDTRTSATTLAFRARDLLAGVPAQRASGDQVATTP